MAYLTIEGELSTEESLLRDITHFETQIAKLSISAADEHRRMLIVYRSLVDDLSRRLLEIRVNAPRVTQVARAGPGTHPRPVTKTPIPLANG